jgi:hypothetical protein
MVPKHLVSNPPGNNRYNDDNMDPYLTQPVASTSRGIGYSEVLRDQHKLQLDRNTLEQHRGEDNYNFDWSVARAIDSGYGSGNVQEPQEPDASFSQDPSVSLAQPFLQPEDKRTTVMWTVGNSDGTGMEYADYLNLEE